MELQPNELEQSTPPETPPAVLRGQEARRGEESRRAIIVEPYFPLRAEREAAAATVGVDEGTYNLLMDMQHRDITPDDYEMLRSLDTSVKPKTLSPRTLELAAPCWEIPDVCVPGTCVPGAGAASPLSASEQQCSICMEALLAGERVRRLPCIPARSTRPGPASTQRARGPPACSGPRSGPHSAPDRGALAAGLPKGGCAPSLLLTLLPAHGHAFDAFGHAGSHIFHAGCVDEWLTRRSNVCPDDGLPVFAEGG